MCIINIFEGHSGKQWKVRGFFVKQCSINVDFWTFYSGKCLENVKRKRKRMQAGGETIEEDVSIVKVGNKNA